MIRFLHNKNYDFIGLQRWAFIATGAFFALGALSFAWRGLNYSIEFTGGTLVQLEFQQPPDISELRSTLVNAGVTSAEIQQFGSPTEFTIRAQDRTTVQEQAAGAERVQNAIETAVFERYGAGNVTVVRAEAVGPRVGAELRRNAIIAILISFAITLVYLAIRFEWRFGLAAIAATAHDILAAIAFVKLMNLEVSLIVVAALLTVVGYSMNDTIVIFDRVRENLRKARKESLKDTLNRSVNETLPRTVLTGVTTITSLLALLIFGGAVIRPFAWVLLFGIIIGTFSSIYIAAPVLLWIEKRWPRPTTTTRGRGHHEPAPRPRGAASRPVASR
ncbi:MAG TPA: protein translocase subunit SecF [Gemmatimonadaceae bacterium]|nr:protein translocase subunit SecF [Gemmatimonadaceae bacterium]